MIGENANGTLEVNFWSLKDAYVSPKPTGGRPIMVSAASSEAGLAYATRYSDLIFITSPGGVDIEEALATLPSHTQHIHELAEAEGREVRTIINPHVICRETEGEVEAVCRAIVDGEDVGAVDGLMNSMGGDQTSWRSHKREQRIIGGNVHVFGTPERVADQLVRLHAAGCNGVQVNFFDFGSDLEFFGTHVIPLLKDAGLRVD